MPSSHRVVTRMRTAAAAPRHRRARNHGWRRRPTARRREEAPVRPSPI